MFSVKVRTAGATDAARACDVVRRSITELCVEDHQRDQATIDAWLANKTTERFETWIGSERHIALVAETHAGLVGFGLMNRDARIALLYVSPVARLQGVSRALIAELEVRARQLGLRRLTLSSSATARRFYESAGYVTDGVPTPGFGRTTAYPMVKDL